ncbi:hypothetical protein ACPSLY_06975 [Vibrio parahaemolyticus]|uniref:hypothetical protein n=1 Tax=Vibrio parahaemolyticus TaxID=670 RepID=UPI0003C78995|nr:hypothetical protein [Vibrio parahaemolyticus]AYO04200.1 hypothetical protein D0871_07835 [Vibrio parahaemolyticus]EGQ9444902.1 hypothetical protein [Vibrio parahaemolyticus]EGR3370981.1 hypothetical protein [Vibrio parahaemolyticus]EHZ2907563.1 hypothetical protein [Vibrio parahaemolyticus]EIF2693317.1 hypothetical protein [Vibrio parahaemolyticus]
MEPLFIIGCIFPLIGWVTFIISSLYQWRAGKNSSAVLIPVIGPVILNFWSVNEGHDWWAFILPWVLDISTVSFLVALPMLVRDELNYSKFNNKFTLKSSKGIQSVKLMLQKNNSYICHLEWSRKKNELGILATKDFGEYEHYDGEFIKLTSHTGKVRILKQSGNEYTCEDHESGGDHNLDGYVFT